MTTHPHASGHGRVLAARMRRERDGCRSSTEAGLLSVRVRQREAQLGEGDAMLSVVKSGEPGDWS